LVEYFKEQAKDLLADTLEVTLKVEILQAIEAEKRYKHKKERKGYLN
jgi:hypothetical protein